MKDLIKYLLQCHYCKKESQFQIREDRFSCYNCVLTKNITKSTKLPVLKEIYDFLEKYSYDKDNRSQASLHQTMTTTQMLTSENECDEKEKKNIN